MPLSQDDTKARKKLPDADSLRSWGDALTSLGCRSFSTQMLASFNRPMYQRFQILDHMGLCSKPMVIARASDFLKSPERFLSAFSDGDLYPYLEPAESGTGLTRFKNKNTPRADVAERVSTLLDGLDPKNFMLSLQASKEIVYNALVVIYPDGRVHGEFSPKGKAPSRQGAEILFTISMEPYLQTMKYTTEDPSIRKAIWTALSRIPQNSDNQGPRFHPGYYEFALVRNGDRMTSHFYDFRSDSFFLPR